jgi:hypothetical protein
MSVDQSVEWELAGKTEVFEENLHQRNLSTTNPTRPDLGPNPCRHSEKPATDRLSYGTAFTLSNIRVKQTTNQSIIHFNGTTEF